MSQITEDLIELAKKTGKTKENLGKELKNLLLKTLNENCLDTEKERQLKIKQKIEEIKKLSS